MSIFLAGDDGTNNYFELVDPASYSEAEYEIQVVKALRRVYPNHYCFPFRGSFALNGQRRIADLAMVHKNYTHWFVIEVELISHSLENHVLPQVQCFSFGEAEDSCIATICTNLKGIKVHEAAALLRFVPSAVAVVVNRFDQEWASCLKALNVQLITLEIYKSADDRLGHKLNGTLQVVQESLGFHQYSAVDRAFRMPASARMPEGLVQFVEPSGVLANWHVRRSNDLLWVSKERGDPALPHDGYLQVLRTYEGKLTLRLPFKHS
jgi:hypothetical protein